MNAHVISGSAMTPLRPLDRRIDSLPQIPDYQLIDRIGAGAYGEVWRAHSVATGVYRAVKVVYRSSFGEERPFNREFEGIKKFEEISRSHTSQLALFHVGRNEAGGYFYYLMELADNAIAECGSEPDRPMPNAESTGTSNEPSGEECVKKSESPHVDDYVPRTLRREIEGGRVAAARVLEIGLALTEALAHLHARGLIHRDVKPSNIIFVSGRPKLADIGLVTDACDQHSIVGTEGYLPPEGPGTAQADIYALGKVLYEALTGLDRRQFPALPPDIREWPDAKLAFELNAVIVKACASGVRDRCPGTTAMLAEFELLRTGKSIKQQRLRKQRLRWGKLVALGAAFLVLFGLAGSALKNEFVRRLTANNSETASFESSGTKDHAAWEAYTIGRHFLAQQTAESLPKAAALFERAVKIDPRFANAYAGMATAYSYWFVTAWQFPPKESIARSAKAAEAALALNPNSAEALAALGFAKFACDYHPDEAEAILRRALVIDPANERAMQWLSRCLGSQRKFKDSIALSRLAVKLHPASLPLNKELGNRLLDAHEFQGAIEQDRITVDLDPNDGLSWDFLAMACQFAKQWPEARDACLRSSALDGDTNMVQKINNAPSPREGALAYWRINFAKAPRNSKQPVDNPFGIAMEAAMAEQYDDAITFLEQAVGAAQSYRTDVWPAFDPLRTDPKYGARFTNVLRRIGFPP